MNRKHHEYYQSLLFLSSTAIQAKRVYINKKIYNILTQTLKLLLNLGLDNLPHALPASTVRNGRDTALALLKTNKFLGKHLAEAVTILIAQGQVNCTSELGRVSGGQRDMSNTGVPLDRAARGSDTHSGVGVENVTAGLGALGATGREVGGEAGLVSFADSSDGLLIADPLAFELGLGGFNDGSGHLEAAFCLELVQPAADALAGVLAALLGRAGLVGLEGEEPEEALEVAADEDVHGWAVGLLDALVRDGIEGLLGVMAVGTEESVENAV